MEFPPKYAWNAGDVDGSPVKNTHWLVYNSLSLKGLKVKNLKSKCKYLTDFSGHILHCLGKMVKESLMYMYKRMNHDVAFYTSLTARPHHMILSAAV